MGKIMAVDYGTKRIGLAVTDDLKIIATGLTTVETPLIWKFLRKYIHENDVECIVVGDPRALDGTETDSTNAADKFSEDLAKKWPKIKMDRMDEAFTSKMAVQAMIAGGMKKKKRRDKGMIDKISATIILQSYMETL